MTDDELEKRQDHVAPQQQRRKVENADDVVADRAYGYDRSNRSALDNLEFRLLHGEWPAEEYSYVHSMGWDPATGNIRISYVRGLVVLISGRNLRRIYDQLRRHRVDFLRGPIHQGI